MIYEKSIDIETTHTKQAPKTETIKVWKGVIHSIEVFIPSGHAGLAHLQIWLGGSIICPINQDGSISGDATTVSAKYHINLHKKVSVIRLVGWNTDDTYPHEFLVRIGVLPEWVLVPQLITTKILENLRDIMSRFV